MTTFIDRARNLGLRMRARALRYVRSRRGNVAAIIAISLVPLAGVMGLGVEGSNWFLQQRAQQNAADAAVVAAANQGLNDYYAACASTCSWGSNYPVEGKAVANKYGYLNGSGNVTVTVTGPDTPTACPLNASIKIAATDSCFKVTVSKPWPLYLTRLVGFTGNTTIGGVQMQMITASAIAAPVSEPANICLLTLGWGANASNGQKYALQFHGSSSVNLEGCPVGTNGGMDCTGHTTLNSPYGVDGNDPHSNQDKSSCGDFAYSQAASIADPDVSLDSNLYSAPYANTCSTYGGSSISGTISAGSPTTPSIVQICGNLTLSGDTTITGNVVYVVENGYLDLAGHNLITSGTGGAGGVAIIFSSPTSAGIPSSVSSGNVGYIQDSAGGGGINISSNEPGSGVWAGITVYQNPVPWNSCNCLGLTGTDNTYTSTWDGNSSKLGWSLSGTYYLPNANLILNGAADKASNGYDCFDMVLNSIDSNGGNSFSMFANPLKQCGQQGSRTPQIYGFRYALVG